MKRLLPVAAGLLLIQAVTPALHAAPNQPSREAVGVMRRGVDAYRKGRLDEAEATLSRAMRMFPGWKTASGFRAVVRMELGDDAGGRADAELANQLQPNSAESFAARGFGRLIFGDRNGAADDFVRAAKMDKRYVPAYLGMALQRRAAGDRPEALANIGIALKTDGSSGIAYTMRGAVYEDAGRNEEALRAYTAAIAMDPETWRSRLPRARILLQAGRTKDAVDDLNRYLERDRYSTAALFLRGQALFQAGEYEGAAIDLDKVLGVEPTHGLALANRGLARSALGDKRGALTDLRQAMTLVPDKRGQIEPQLAAIEKELGVGPGRPDGYDADERHRSTSFFAALGRRLRGNREEERPAPRTPAPRYRYEYEAAPVMAEPLFAKAWNRPAGAPAENLRDSLNNAPSSVRTYSTYRETGARPSRAAVPANPLSSFQAAGPRPSERDPRRAAISASILRRHGVGGHARAVSYEAPRYDDFRDAPRSEPSYDAYAPVAQRYEDGPTGFIERLGAIVRGRASSVRPYREGDEEPSRIKRFARDFFTPAPKDENFIYHRTTREEIPAAGKLGDYEQPDKWEMPYRNPADDGEAVYQAMGRPAPEPVREPEPVRYEQDFRDAPAPLPHYAVRPAPRYDAPPPRTYAPAPRYDEPVERGYQERIRERYYSDAPAPRTRRFVDPRYGRSKVADYQRKRRTARPAQPVLIY